MSPDRLKMYRSYLIRCWMDVAPASDSVAVRRFIVEEISATPRRWGFATLDELIDFLWIELGYADDSNASRTGEMP